jgi:hypothetical protein
VIRREALTVKRLFVKLLLVGLGLAAGFFVFEGYLRLTSQGSEGFYQPDPYLGAFHIPNTEGVWQKACFKTWVRFNSRGLRDDVEHTLEKPEGVYRIVVLGDSYAEALQVKLEESFPKILEGLLNNANLGRRFEVINLGNSGFGTDQEYLSLKYYGLQYDADLVILAFLTGNDVRNNYVVLERQTHDWPKPFFVFDEQDNLVQLPFRVRSTPATWFRGILAHFWIYGWLREKVYTSPLLHRWFWRLGLVMLTPPDERQAEGDQNEKARIPLDFQVFLEHYPPEWKEAWRITKALIVKTKEEAERHEARFLLVSLTDGVQLAQPNQVNGEYPGLKGVRYNLDKPVEILTEFSKNEAIDYLPLLPLYRQYLREQRESVEGIHYSCDGHWTSLGHLLAGEAIFHKILGDRLYETRW